MPSFSRFCLISWHLFIIASLFFFSQDLADDELAQVKVLETYLPKQMSAEELEAALKEIIAEVGATSGKDMGKVSLRSTTGGLRYRMGSHQ